MNPRREHADPVGQWPALDVAQVAAHLRQQVGIRRAVVLMRQHHDMHFHRGRAVDIHIGHTRVGGHGVKQVGVIRPGHRQRFRGQLGAVAQAGVGFVHRRVGGVLLSSAGVSSRRLTPTLAARCARSLPPA